MKHMPVQIQIVNFDETFMARLLSIHLPVCLWIIDPYNRASKKNTSHGNEVLLQDTTYLIQKPHYQRGSSYQDPASNRTTRRPPDHRKETQAAVIWSCLPFIKSAKAILQGTMKGGRSQGRQRKRWEDNTREWTGLEFAKSQRLSLIHIWRCRRIT